MVYVDFCAGNKLYKLRLNTRGVVRLEKVIGCNPLAIFGDGDELPTITTMVAVLNEALQPLNHGITLNDSYDIFDAWLNEGHNTTEFVKVIVDIYRVSGLIPSEIESEVEKN
mgnify:FL=1